MSMENIMFILVAWTVVACCTTQTVYFYFDHPWYGPNKVWWSVLLHLPLIILFKIIGH